MLNIGVVEGARQLFGDWGGKVKTALYAKKSKNQVVDIGYDPAA